MEINFNQASASRTFVWFLFLTSSVCVCPRACVSAPEAINYIHMILNLYNQLNKFVTFRDIMKQYYAWAWPMYIIYVAMWSLVTVMHNNYCGIQIFYGTVKHCSSHIC